MDIFQRTAAALIGSALLTISTGNPQAGQPGPEDVVKSFNQALTARNIDNALPLFAKGSVQFTLKAAHPGMTTPTGLTTDLRTHWSTIAPLLFTVTKTYKRVPTVVQSRVEGDLATVWTRIASQTVEPNGKSREDSFGEVYVLIRGPDGWKIGAIADNRGTDKLDVGTPAPPAASGR